VLTRIQSADRKRQPDGRRPKRAFLADHEPERGGRSNGARKRGAKR
jgi:hypothetical protein